MCNACNMAFEVYLEARQPLLEAYEKTVESLSCLKDVIPFFEAYQEVRKPLYEAYQEAIKNCKDK